MYTTKQGPVSLRHLKHVFEFKMSQDMFKTKLCFIKLYIGHKNRYLSLYICTKLHVLTMAVIFEAEEDDKWLRLKKTRVFRDRYINALQFCFLLTCIYIVKQFWSWKHASAPPPISGSFCRHIVVPGSCTS